MPFVPDFSIFHHPMQGDSAAFFKDGIRQRFMSKYFDNNGDNRLKQIYHQKSGQDHVSAQCQE